MERKKAVLSVGNVLLDISLATLATIGGATSNPLLAAPATAALTAKENLAPFLAVLKGKKEEVLELPVPNWWSGDERSWQDACAEVEHRLPRIINATAEQLKKEAQVPTSEIIQRVFIAEIGSQLSPWIVGANSQNLMAAYVATPFLQKAATALKVVVDPIRDDATARKLEALARTLQQVADAQATQTVTTSSSSLSTANVPAAQQPVPSASSTLSLAELLEQKWQNGEYDVYVCYHEADQAEVRKIDAKLKAQGILPWFDIITADPTGVLQTEQDQQIRKIKSAAVFIGRHAVEDWQALQVQALLDQFVERKFLRIIPVFLDDAPEKPEMSVFLRLFTGVDFRQQVPDPFGRLMWGITGKRPPISSFSS